MSQPEIDDAELLAGIEDAAAVRRIRWSQSSGSPFLACERGRHVRGTVKQARATDDHVEIDVIDLAFHDHLFEPAQFMAAASFGGPYGEGEGQPLTAEHDARYSSTCPTLAH
jgi:hypothetical protein